MDGSHILEVRVLSVCVSVCVCLYVRAHVKCQCLYIAVGNAYRQSARLKLAVWATCLPLTKPEMERWREQEGRRGWRSGRRGEDRGGKALIRLLV